MNRKMFALIVMSGAGCFCGCSSVGEALNLKRPTASLKGVRIGEVSLETATLLFDVEVQNHYPVKLPLAGMEYSVVSNAKPLFSGVVDVEEAIGARSSTGVTLPVKIGYLEVLYAFKGIRPGAYIPYQAKASLSVEAPALGLIQLPLKKDGKLSVPKIPALNEMDWKQMLLDRAKELTE